MYVLNLPGEKRRAVCVVRRSGWTRGYIACIPPFNLRGWRDLKGSTPAHGPPLPHNRVWPLPMVFRALQAQGNPQLREAAKKALDVQEAALKAVADEAFHGAIDGKTRELAILPRVCWLVVKGTAVRVKVNALLCLSRTFHFFMVRAVVDKVGSLPPPFVLLATLVCGSSSSSSTRRAFLYFVLFSSPLQNPARRFPSLGIFHTHVPLAGGPLFGGSTPPTAGERARSK